MPSAFENSPGIPCFQCVFFFNGNVQFVILRHWSARSQIYAAQLPFAFLMTPPDGEPVFYDEARLQVAGCAVGKSRMMCFKNFKDIYNSQMITDVWSILEPHFVAEHHIVTFPTDDSSHSTAWNVISESLLSSWFKLRMKLKYVKPEGSYSGDCRWLESFYLQRLSSSLPSGWQKEEEPLIPCKRLGNLQTFIVHSMTFNFV